MPMMVEQGGSVSFTGDVGEPSGDDENTVIIWYDPPPPSDLNIDLISYWKADNLTPAGSDSIGANDVDTFTGIATSAGLYGAGWQQTGGVSSHATINAPATGLNFSASTSFMCRCWVNLPPPFSGSVAVLKLNTAGTVRMGFTSGANPTFSMRDSLNVAKNVTSSAYPTRGIWQRIVWYYDASSLEIGIKINDDAWDITSVPDGFTTLGLGEDIRPLEIDPKFGAALFVDEIAIWSRILSATELTDDWNSGSGLTYPF